VLAFAPLAAQQPADLAAVLGRAAGLAGSDETQLLAVARVANAYGQPLLAANLAAPLLAAAHPSRDALVLAADLAETRGDYLKALDLLERAQEVASDEPESISEIRRELIRIDTIANLAAVQSTGADRAKAVERALANAARWRAIDPGNDDIDRRVGTLLLAVGDTRGAWRQLSSIIERDPWSGAGYATLAQQLENQGKVSEALDLWQQAIVIDQTNPTHRLRRAQALMALGRTQEGEAVLRQIASAKWHPMWEGTVYQAKELLRRGKSP